MPRETSSIDINVLKVGHQRVRIAPRVIHRPMIGSLLHSNFGHSDDEPRHRCVLGVNATARSCIVFAEIAKSLRRSHLEISGRIERKLRRVCKAMCT